MSNWIKCSDELPELKDDGVLVYFGAPDFSGFCGHGIETVHIQDSFGDVTAGLDGAGNQLYSKMYLSQGITHWQPLPAPPAE